MTGAAQGQVTADWRTAAAAGQRAIVVEVFVRNDSQRCDNAVDYLRNLESQRRGLRVRVYDVLKDQAALTRLWSISRRAGLEQAGVPTFYTCGKVHVGFADPRTDGSRIRELYTVHAYVRQGCSHCRAARAYLARFQQAWPAVPVVFHDAIQDRAAQAQYNELCNRYGIRVRILPAFHVGGRFIVGYQGAATERQIEAIFVSSSQLTGIKWSAPAARPPPRATQPAKARPTSLTADVGVALRVTTRPSALPEIRFAFRSAEAARDQRLRRAKDDDAPFVFQAVRWSHEAFQDSEATNKREAEGPAPRSELPADAPLLNDAPAIDPVPAADSVPLPDQVPFPDNLPSVDEVPLPDEYPASEAVPPLNGDQLDPIGPDLSNDGGTDESPIVVELPLFGEVRVDEIGLPAFTLAIGLVDGFNPCAMWVLIFLLSVLVNIQSRAKIVMIAGTFVLVSGLAYFAFMAAWLNVFLILGWQRPLQVALGLLATVVGVVNVKDFVAFKRGVTFSIPESAKPGIYSRVRRIVSTKYLTVALAGAFVLAVLVNVVELLCTAGLPAVYTQVLYMHELPPLKNYAYLGLYNLAYMLDDSIMLAIAVVTLSHRRMQEREGRWLKLISGIVMLTLGLLMLLKPQWLSWSV